MTRKATQRHSKSRLISRDHPLFRCQILLSWVTLGEVGLNCVGVR